MAKGTTYVHSVVLERYINRKFKHHKTTPKVQRVKLVLLHVDGLRPVSAVQCVANSCVRKPRGSDPRRTHRFLRKAGPQDDEVHVLPSTSGKLRNTQHKTETRKIWRLQGGSLHPSSQLWPGCSRNPSPATEFSNSPKPQNPYSIPPVLLACMHINWDIPSG